MNIGPDSYLEILTRLGAAFALGGLLGFEREWSKRPAGLRTHILVAVASALFTIMSVAVAGKAGDVSRIAAGVVTGIGFIGAGTIMRHGNAVRGLTTAASLWMVAAIGVACGFEWYWAASVTTVIALVTLVVVDRLEETIRSRRNEVQFGISIAPGRYVVRDVVEVLDRHGVPIVDLTFEGTNQTDMPRLLVVTARLGPGTQLQHLLCEQFESISGVENCSIA